MSSTPNSSAQIEWHRNPTFPGLVYVRGKLALCGHIRTGTDLLRAIEELSGQSVFVQISGKHPVDEDGSVTRNLGPNLRAVIIFVPCKDQVQLALARFRDALARTAPDLVPAIA